MPLHLVMHILQHAIDIDRSVLADSTLTGGVRVQGSGRLGSTVTKQHPLWLRFHDDGLEREFAWWHSIQMQKVLGTTPA